MPGEGADAACGWLGEALVSLVESPGQVELDLFLGDGMKAIIGLPNLSTKDAICKPGISVSQVIRPGFQICSMSQPSTADIVTTICRKM